ncbi:carbon storage regulator CsrA [Vibrio crassostreae]|uniref:carbon storage regulator n=1 Tax=Vibrio crassostreae TaxID=246167 RepID=UPI000F46E51C|nr:carbon storage regulator [Vibrio crassostreae]ROR22254.1 carbon storage regulator CsrA [Vibrio crassostreae]
MLRLTRKVGQSLTITDENGTIVMEVTVCKMSSGQVGLGISSDRDKSKIYRTETMMSEQTKALKNHAAPHNKSGPLALKSKR